MDGYIAMLRKHIGKAPIVAAAAGVIIRRGDEILLQKRSDNGKWAIHGGSIEPGESVEETARREVFEETGLTVHKIELFKVFSGERMHCIYPNGDEAYVVNIIFTCRDFSGQLVADKQEVRELKWFSIDSLPLELSEPIDKAIVNEYINSLNH